MTRNSTVTIDKITKVDLFICNEATIKTKPAEHFWARVPVVCPAIKSIKRSSPVTIMLIVNANLGWLLNGVLLRALMVISIPKTRCSAASSIIPGYN